MKRRSIRWGAALGGALASEVVLIAAAFLWAAIYSYFLHPGESLAFYQRYALQASPWVSLIVGIPVFYLACHWIGSRSPSTAWPTAMAFYALYLLMDAPVTLLGGDNPNLSGGFLAINYAAKFLACHLGGRSAARKEVAEPA